MTAMVAMFFLMYTNSYQILDQAWFSEERLFMTLVMGGSMMIIMLAFMLQMYKSSKMNIAIFIGGALLLIGAIWLSRSQATIDEVDYMEGMIPHHSIAILTSERADIRDPRVQKLAKEIMEMEWLINDTNQ